MSKKEIERLDDRITTVVNSFFVLILALGIMLFMIIIFSIPQGEWQCIEEIESDELVNCEEITFCCPENQVFWENEKMCIDKSHNIVFRKGSSYPTGAEYTKDMSNCSNTQTEIKCEHRKVCKDNKYMLVKVAE